jgi:hypothetical protein
VLRHCPAARRGVAGPSAVLVAARPVATMLVRDFATRDIVAFHDNAARRRQQTPHARFRVVPRQPGSGWRAGPPQLVTTIRAGARVAVHGRRAAAHRGRGADPVEAGGATGHGGAEPVPGSRPFAGRG